MQTDVRLETRLQQEQETGNLVAFCISRSFHPKQLFSGNGHIETFAAIICSSDKETTHAARNSIKHGLFVRVHQTSGGMTSKKF